MTNVPFRYLGTVDVSFFLEVIEQLNWNTYTERQEKRFGMQDTYTIPLVWDINFKSRKRWSDYSLVEEELINIEKTLNKGEKILSSLSINGSGQLWLRYSDLNPGTQINNNEVQDFWDISVRRYRLGFKGEVSDKIDFALLLSWHSSDSRGLRRPPSSHAYCCAPCSSLPPPNTLSHPARGLQSSRRRALISSASIALPSMHSASRSW